MKLILVSFALFLLMAPVLVKADLGIGMGPSKLSLSVETGKQYSAEAVAFNPGDYDIRARLGVTCKTCTYDYKIFGWRIGDVQEDYQQFFTFVPDDLYIPNRTTAEAGIPIKMYINPSIWLHKTLVIVTPESLNYLVTRVNPDYDGRIRIPYLSILTDEKNVQAQLSLQAYWSTFGSMGAAPAVGVPLNMHITGMPTGSLYIIVIMLLIIVGAALYFAFRKGLLSGVMKMLQRRKHASSVPSQK